MSDRWPAVDYADWSATCDTLHAHSQVLGKLAAVLAPPEPQFQHLALRLTARGWETLPLPAPDGGGAFVVVLDLRSHETRVEHSDGRERPVALAPDRPVGKVTREVLDAVRELAGPVEFDPAPDEVWWNVPLDEDDEHRSYDPQAVGAYLLAASRAALALGAIRSSFPGPATPINAWWGSFDVAVSLFAGEKGQIDVGWWPGDPKNPKAAFYAYATPAPEGFGSAEPAPSAARWDANLGEYLLDWNDVIAAADPGAFVVEFGRAATDLLR